MDSKDSPPEVVGMLRFYACSVTVEEEEDNYEEGREYWSDNGHEPVGEEVLVEEGEEQDEEEEEAPPPPYTTSPTTRIVDSRHIPSDNHMISTTAKPSRYFSSSRRSVLNKPQSNLIRTVGEDRSPGVHDHVIVRQETKVPMASGTRRTEDVDRLVSKDGGSPVDKNEPKPTERSPVVGKAPENINHRISVLPLKYDIGTEDIKPNQQLWFAQTPTGWISGTSPSPTKTPPPEQKSPFIGRPPVVTLRQRSPSPPRTSLHHVELTSLTSPSFSNSPSRRYSQSPVKLQHIHDHSHSQGHNHNHSQSSYVDDAFDEDEDEHISVQSLAHSHRTTTTQPPTSSSTTIDLSNLRMSTASFLSHNLLFDQQSFRTLKVLILRNNGLDDLKALHLNTKVLPCLVDIDLAYNQFTGTVPNGAFPPSILRLDLSHNQLDNIDSLGSCQSLEALMVQNNSLRFLGCLPSQLQSLDLSNNLLADRLNLRLLSLCPRLKVVRIAGNPTAERQAMASRVTITSVLPALEQLDDLLLPGRKVRRRKASPLRPPSTSGATVTTGRDDTMASISLRSFRPTASMADAQLISQSQSPEGLFQMAFPDAAGGINEATSQAHEAQQQTQTNGHNTVASPSRESSESFFSLGLGPPPATNTTNSSKFDERMAQPKHRHAWVSPPRSAQPPLPVIRLNKKYIESNQHRLNKQAHKRDHEMKRMEDAVHAQARRMEVKLTPEAAQELVSRLYCDGDEKTRGASLSQFTNSIGNTEEQVTKTTSISNLRSRVTDAIGELRQRHYSRQPHHPQPEIGGMSVFLPLSAAGSDIANFNEHHSRAAERGSYPQQPVHRNGPAATTTPFAPATTTTTTTTSASATTSNPSFTNKKLSMSNPNPNPNPQTIFLDDFMFDDEGCYVETIEDEIVQQATVGPADGVFDDDHFLHSFPAQPQRRTAAPLATQSSSRGSVRQTDKGLPHHPQPINKHNFAHTQALAQPKRRIDVSIRDFPSSRQPAATTTGQRDNNRRRSQIPPQHRDKDKDKDRGNYKAYATREDLPARPKGVRPSRQVKEMPPPPPPPLYDHPVSPVSLKSAVFGFADVYPGDAPETTHVERNEGRRDEVDTAADNDGDDEDWIEVAEELLAQTPIDGSGRDEQLVMLMQLLAQANELAAGQSTVSKSQVVKSKSPSPWSSPSPSSLNIALSPSHPHHPANPIHHTPPASPTHSRVVVEDHSTIGAGDASPLNRSGSAIQDSPPQVSRSRRVSDVSLASIEILEMFPKWKNATTFPAGNISNNSNISEALLGQVPLGGDESLIIEARHDHVGEVSLTPATVTNGCVKTQDVSDSHNDKNMAPVPAVSAAPNSPPLTATIKGNTQGEFVAHRAQALNQTLSPSFTSPSRTSRDGHKHKTHQTTPPAAGDAHGRYVHDSTNFAVTPELPKKALLQWKVRRKIAELGEVIKEHYKETNNTNNNKK